jgi:hypothetical protein
MPAFDLFTTLGAFYCEVRRAPANQQALAAFAEKRGKIGVWKQLRESDLSETAEEIVWRVSIVAPSSLSANGEIATSWRFALKKPRTEQCSLQFTIAPESRFCVRGERDPNLWAVELFVDLSLVLLSKASKTPAPPSVSGSPPADLCFDPSLVRSRTNEEAVTTERLKKKLEEILRQKQQPLDKAS